MSPCLHRKPRDSKSNPNPNANPNSNPSLPAHLEWRRVRPLHLHRRERRLARPGPNHLDPFPVNVHNPPLRPALRLKLGRPPIEDAFDVPSDLGFHCNGSGKDDGRLSDRAVVPNGGVAGREAEANVVELGLVDWAGGACKEGLQVLGQSRV
jgi:hypothetical protein